MDFRNAQLPQLTPLAESFAENEQEDAIRRLMLKIYRDLLAEDEFDISVLGVAHLGSARLVSRSITRDGLTMIGDAGREERTRYLYRAWNSGNKRGRGLHFLRTYLQMQFPNQWIVRQMWHDKAQAASYPEQLREDAGDGENFLTSRIRVRIHEFPKEGIEKKVAACMSLVLPARIVPLPLEFAGGNDGAEHPVKFAQMGTTVVLMRAESAPDDRKIKIGQAATVTMLLRATDVPTTD
jgi:hypothetical protein